MTSTTMDPLRCTGLKQAVLSDDGRAVLLELFMANSKIFPLELDAAGVDLLTRALLMSAQALAKAEPPARALAETDPAHAVQLQTDALALRGQPGGEAALLLRVGTLDLHLSGPDTPRLAAALAR